MLQEGEGGTNRSLQPKQSRVEAGERSSSIMGLATALSHFCKEPEKKLLPSVCITGRRQREEAGGGG